MRIAKGKKLDYFKLLKQYTNWKKYVGKSPLDNNLPWMTFDAIEYLSKYLTKSMSVVEYGSGGSSIFFASNAGKVFSVEHDAEWFAIVDEKIKKLQLKNWTGNLILPVRNVDTSNLDFENAEHYFSSDASFKNCTFKSYATSISSFENNSVDVVIVDGRVRPSCIMESISKIKVGGILVLDNSNRESYFKAVEKYLNPNYKLELNSFGPTAFNPEFTQTSIWKKIKL